MAQDRRCRCRLIKKARVMDSLVIFLTCDFNPHPSCTYRQSLNDEKLTASRKIAKLVFKGRSIYMGYLWFDPISLLLPYFICYSRS